MNFSVLTPLPPPPYPGIHFWGGVWGWGGSKLLCVLRPLCVDLDLDPDFFFLYMDPRTHGGGPGFKLQVPPVAPPLWALAGEDFFALDRLFSGT